MSNLLSEQVFDQAVNRAERSRHSYNVQTAEFRSLNGNLQIYLEEIRTIDQENRNLQDKIEEIRRTYLNALEYHLLRVPEHFREQSRTLTAAHVERYKLKSRARRFIAEREELKRRIHFVASDEKEQLKRLNRLQKYHRTIEKDYLQLKEQIQRLVNVLENEKVLHRQAMERVDQLQHRFEQICVERSKTEFEIQSLKEEVQLMQTAREFLDDERESLRTSQTEANEYFLSHLNESIQRIRDDFEQLNRRQLEQIEDDYGKKLRSIEDYLEKLGRSESDADQSPSNLVEMELLENEHRIIVQELNIVTDQHQTLTERVHSMEIDLHTLREDRRRQLNIKDQEFERNQMQLQTLNEQLIHLAEYDRNLKFELTLYRGVLENEYRRKQQQRTTSMTTMRNESNFSPTEKTRTTFPTLSETADEETTVSTARVRLESDYDSLPDLTSNVPLSINSSELAEEQTVPHPIIEVQPPSSTETSTTSLRSVEQSEEMVVPIRSSSSSITHSDETSSVTTVIDQSNELTNVSTEDTIDVSSSRIENDSQSQTISILPAEQTEHLSPLEQREVPRVSSPISEGEPEVVIDLTQPAKDQDEGGEVETNATAPPPSTNEAQTMGDLSSIVIQPVRLDESSQDSSFTDVEDITVPPAQAPESKSTEEIDQDPVLISIMQDLRFVFHDLANENGVLEINAALPDKLLDRLEFRDHLIRTLFDSLLRKYLVQSAEQSNRSKTLDWTEFRDILFPIITGRRTERQIRTLFNLFDTSKDGYLSLQEIAELLEILQANDTIDLAQTIIDEYDTDHDGKLSADELIEAIKKTDDIAENVLPEEIETKQWFNQAPTDEMSASLEVLIGTSEEKSSTTLTERMTTLAHIFENLAAPSQNHVLNSVRENLAMEITNELIKMDMAIPSADLERFIQLFLDKRQETDPLISWTDFRDLLIPIIDHGSVTAKDLERYFDLFGQTHREYLTNEEFLQLLRLFQFVDVQSIAEELSETRSDPNADWTIEDLFVAFDRLLSAIPDEQRRNIYDLDWFLKIIQNSNE